MYRIGAVGVPRMTDAGSSVCGNTLFLGISVNRGSPALGTHLVYEQAPDGRPEDEPYDEVHISH